MKKKIFDCPHKTSSKNSAFTLIQHFALQRCTEGASCLCVMCVLVCLSSDFEMTIMNFNVTKKKN